MATAFTMHPQQPWQEMGQALHGWPESPLPAPLTRRLHALLTCAGSLTRCLETCWHPPVSVEILHQCLAPAWQDEDWLWRDYPTPSATHGILIRNTWLHVAGRRRVFAQAQLDLTRVPATLHAAIQRGEHPLGTLFLDQAMEVSRQAVELTTVCVPDLPDVSPGTMLWCRRSLFRARHPQEAMGVDARIAELFLDSGGT
jgi:chorismate-pyruvate lyase